MSIDKEKETFSINESTNEVIKEEFHHTFFWYMFSFFIIYVGSFLLPLIIFVLFMVYVYSPFFLEITDFITLFTQIPSLIVFISMPIVFVGCIIIHLLLVGFITRWLWNITEKITPSKEGIIPRNIKRKTLTFYHIRSFLIKYGKNSFNKGIFPWGLKWFYNFVGSNKIGKGAVLEEQVAFDRYIEIGKNSYIGVNSGISSHAVDGIFGNISYFKVKLGDNVTTGGINCIAPDVEIKNNSYLLPLASTAKHCRVKGNNYYFGIPMRKIFKKKIMNYLDISEEQFDENVPKLLEENDND